METEEKRELREAIKVFKARGDRERWLNGCANLYGIDKAEGKEEMRRLRKELTKDAQSGGAEAYALLKKSYLATAREDFDDYMVYVEWDREPDKKFWLPRRKKLLPVVRDIQRLIDGDLSLLSISLPPGTGKALADNTPVLTNKGWKNHGDLRVGDYVVSDKGKYVKVIAVHPKCKMEYRIEFSNGESVICHGNHEWVVYNRHRQKWQTLSVNEILEQSIESGTPNKRGHRYNYILPSREIMIGRHSNTLAVDPYTLGVWLGDGANKNPLICNAKQDCAIVEKLLANGNEFSWQTEHKDTGVMYYGIKDLRKKLRVYDMCHSRKALPKHIPEEYLNASIEQRLELLAGLVDTDGCVVQAKNEVRFTTSDVSLRDSFISLISTFGWRVSVSTEQPKISSTGIKANREHYVIRFMPSVDIPCALKRKHLKAFSKSRRVAITSITRIDERIKGNCITVEGGVYCVGNTMLPTHNSTLKIFLLSQLIGRYPDKPNLDSGHSGMMTQSTYDGVLSILTDKTEYGWWDVFPLAGEVITNAKELTIDIGKKHRFSSLTCRAIGASLTGATRCEGLMSADDLVSGIEEAMSKDRLDKKWEAYNNDLKSRKKLGCKELHIATRWSVHDVIGRLERQYEGDETAKFIVIPALNEQGESNFDYSYGVGFDKKFFEDMKAGLDDASFKALYMNQPIEREGLLYHSEDLQRFYELPAEEPDAILGVCDTAEGGGDDTVLPVFAQYGDRHYLIDCVCSDALPEVTDGLCAEVLLKNKVKMCQFESNSAGGRTADKVQEHIKKEGGSTHITKKRTTANKATKIIVNSPWIKEHCLFLDEKKIKKGTPYARMMDKLLSYTVAGKNKHDDVPDAMAQYAIFVQSLEGNTVQVIQRPF